MTKIKKVLALSLAALLTLSLVACSSSSSTDSGSSAAGNGSASSSSYAKPKVDINNGDKFTIAYIPMSSAQEDFAVIVDGMKEALANYTNAKLLTYDAGFDANKQIQMINECVTQGVNAIIVNSMDSTALNSTIEAAEKAGVAVISLNNGCDGTHTFHIMNTDYDSGYAAAKYLDGVLNGQGNVVILDVDATLKATCRMGTAFQDYIQKTGHFKLLEDNSVALTTIENGYNATAQMLAKYKDIKVIYCVNDDMAIGAYQAIKAANRLGDGIIIWGFTGTPAALDAISKGNITGTSYTDPFYEGYASIVSALYFLQTGVNAESLGGMGYVPKVVLPTTIVTKDNVQSIIKGTHWDMKDYND